MRVGIGLHGAPVLVLQRFFVDAAYCGTLLVRRCQNPGASSNPTLAWHWQWRTQDTTGFCFCARRSMQQSWEGSAQLRLSRRPYHHEHLISQRMSSAPEF
jgi:hypothetical protein